MRALIIGSGSIGRRHMENLLRAVPDVDFILLRHSSQEPPAAAPSARVTTRLEEALAWSPDMALVANPSAHHFAVLGSLIDAGVPSYVEKPVVTRADEVEALRLRLAAAPDAAHATGYNLRLLPSLTMARTLLRNGAVGTIARVNIEAGQWLPDWRPGQDHRQSYSASSADGGGVIFDLSHELDAARFLVGELELISVITQSLPILEIASESVAVIAARSGSVPVTISMDYVARSPIRRYQIVGDRATLVWDLPQRRLTLSNAQGIVDQGLDASDFDVRQTYVKAMEDFVAAVRGQPRILQSIEDGLRSAELAIRAHGMNERA